MSTPHTDAPRGALVIGIILALFGLVAVFSGGCALPPPPATQPVPPRPVTIVVVHDGQPVVGATVIFDQRPDPLLGSTNDHGFVTFASVAGSATVQDRHVWIAHKDFVPFDAHVDLASGPQTLTYTLTAAEPPPPALADPRDVRANFCALTDPVTSKPIFTSFWPSQDDATRARWLELARAAGDTHYVVSVVQGYGTLYPDHFSFLDAGRMPEFNLRLRELLKAGLRPVVFAHSGDAWPAGGADYFRRFIAAVDPDLRAACLWVPGWEVVPGGWSTWQLCQATRALREALGGNALDGPHMAIHLGDGRLSFSSWPGESDDPFRRWQWPVRNGDGSIVDWESGPHMGDDAEQDKALTTDPEARWAGDEIASVRSWYGQQYSVYLYQSPLIRPSDPLDLDTDAGEWGRAHECLSRVTGDGWRRAPDWFAGLPVRWRPVMFEANEEWFIRGVETRERMLAMSAAALRMGWQGYGFGGQR